ncbi:MAG TPA: HD domain-containing protein [Patescibacteria group bacterium]|nr:HD domain-containing protein [Patescibacteria group bacterium]
MTDLELLADFFVESNKLKKTMRYSSCPKEIKEPVAGHCWKVTLMVPIIARELGLNINIQHAMEIANVHDLAEYVDDEDYDYHLVDTGLLSKEEKDKSEEAVMSALKNRFSFLEQIYSLWKEYGDCKTPEARLVKVLDKLEAQLHIIERGGIKGNPKDLVCHLTYADNAVRNFPQLEPLLRVVKSRLRPLVEAQGLVWKAEYNYPD